MLLHAMSLSFWLLALYHVTGDNPDARREHGIIIATLTSGIDERIVPMELDVSIDKDSLSITIDDPFQYDLDALTEKISAFILSKGAHLNKNEIRELIPAMITGIAGCEHGCPSDAKRLVSLGYKDFELSYIDGGILSAEARTENQKVLSIKLFPDF